jgi:hypothetical protein
MMPRIFDPSAMTHRDAFSVVLFSRSPTLVFLFFAVIFLRSSRPSLKLKASFIECPRSSSLGICLEKYQRANAKSHL